jgi:hypothetical protein
MTINGIKTSFWGPHAWAYLFSSIAGAYPVKVNSDNKEHMKTVKAFKQMFASMAYTLPCIFCRQSFSIFLKDIVIDNYTGSRKTMMYWLYLIHDRVNKKLIQQEYDCFLNEKAVLAQKLKNKKLSTLRYAKEVNLLKKNVLKTKGSPSFDSVLAMYEKQRAGCNPVSKRCA